MIKQVLTILALFVCTTNTNAQFISTTNQTAIQLAQTLVGNGIAFSNATLVCNGNANAKFTNNLTSLVGMDSGIVLTSGTAVGIGSPATTFLSASPGTGSDAQLSAVTGVTTFDVCKLEFDFIPVGDSIKFNYVFASEEYPTYACSSFGDVFGFFINGPGITGTVNMAVVPGTNIPITINSVNGSTAPNTFCTNMGPGSPFTMYYINNAASTTIAYNGMTTMFTALAQVVPCSTYHLKLAIADGSDASFDSGVFLKEGSLVSTPISANPQGGSLNGIQGLTVPHPYAVRNCLAGTFKFSRPVATPTPYTIHYNIGGSAINGSDYIQIADSVVIPANQTQATVLINPVSPPTGTDSVILYLLNPYTCGGSNIIDSVKLWIYDSLQANILTNDTTICAGQSKQILTYGDNLLAYSWTPAAYLNNPNIKNPIATPPSTTTFYLTATLPGSSCPAVHDQVTITIPTLSGPPTSNSPVCAGQTIILTPPPGLPGGTVYSWTGPNGYSSLAQNPTIPLSSTLNAGVYTLTVTSNGCAFAPQTVTVVVNVPPVVAPTSNSPLCTGQTLTLFSNVVGAATYAWTGPGGFSSIAQNPTRPNMIPAWAGIYNVTVTQNGCTANAAFTFVTVSPGLIPPNANNNGPLCVGSTLNLTTTPVPGATSYTWTGPNGWTANTQNPSILGVTALQAGNYIVVANSANCTSAPDTTTVVVTPSPVISGSAFTNPTGCNSNTGTITFNITPNGNYTGTYVKNGGTPTAISPTASGGQLTISNLGAGTYTNFIFNINGCSVTFPGPITLVDPSAPPAPTAGSNSPVCEGQTITLTATNVAGATYGWTGPGGWTSALQNPTRPTATVAMSGNYSVVANVNGCLSAPGIVNVVVNPVPATPSASTSNSPVCSGNTINFTGAPSTVGASWSWTGPGGWTANTQNPTRPAATVAMSGTYTVTANIGACVSQPYTLNVIVNQTPSITQTNNSPSVCGGNDGSIVLSVIPGIGTYTVNYSKNSAPQPAITGTGATITIPNLTAGNYTNITVTQNGCTSNALGPVLLVDPNAPATPTASNSGPVCAGQSVTLTAGNTAPGVIYIWTGPGFSDTAVSTTVPSVTTTTTFSLVANLNGCNSTPVTTTVNVIAAPAAPTTTVNSPLCEGDNIYLTAASSVAGATYHWSGPNAFATTTQNPTINGAVPNMSGDYIVYITSAAIPCPSMNDTVTVVVNPTPAAPTVVSPTETCQNTTHQLSAQGQNLLWYTAATGGTGVPTMTATTTNAGSTTYYVSQTINGCEGPRAPITIIVKPQPTAPVAQLNYTYCQYETTATQLTATGNNLVWYDGNNNVLPGAPTPGTQVPGTFHYFVTQTDSACESNKTDITVLINAKPGLPVVEQITICQDEASPSLNAQGQNLTWYDSATGGTSSPVPPAVPTSTTGTFDYYVSQTVNGCESDRALIRVTVNPKVVADFNTDKDTVCDSYPLNITFTGIAPVGASYDWSFDGASEVTGTGAGPYVVTWTEKGPKTITLTVTNLNCTSTITKTIMVLETPDPNFAIQPDACINEEVRVQAAYNQMDLPGYNWTFQGAEILSGSGYGPYTLKWTTPGQYYVSMSLTNIPCPSLPHFDTINIHHPEAKVMSQSESTVCASDSVLFTAKPGLDYQYAWTPTTFFGEGSDNMSMWAVVKSKSYVTLTVTDRWGCKSADSILVEPKSCCEVFIPNTFTPNGDGKNDVFRMVTKGNQDISVFIIMDRWGKRVFESVNQYEAWDGSHNGEPQDMGTYQYYLRYRCSDGGEIMEMKGDVILLR